MKDDLTCYIHDTCHRLLQCSRFCSMVCHGDCGCQNCWHQTMRRRSCSGSALGAKSDPKLWYTPATSDTSSVYSSACLFWQSLITYTEDEATAGSTPWHESLLVVHLTEQEPLLLKHLGVLQSDPAVRTGEVSLVPVTLSCLTHESSLLFCGIFNISSCLHSSANDGLLALGADHLLLVLLHPHLSLLLPPHVLHSTQHYCHQ